MAHALSADRSAVSKSIATSFIAMASLKIQFFTRHREAGTQRPPARRRSIFLHLQLPRRWLRAHVLVIGRRDRRAAASPRMSRTPHFSTVRIDTTAVRENTGDQHDGGRLALEDNNLIIPLENGTQPRSQQVPPLQLTDINSLKVLANGVLGISAHIEIIWQNEACSKHLYVISWSFFNGLDPADAAALAEAEPRLKKLAGVGFHRREARLGGSSKKPSPFSALVLSGEARHETSTTRGAVSRHHCREWAHGTGA